MGTGNWFSKVLSPVIPASAGFCILALLYQVVAEACFFPSELYSHNEPFYLLTSIPGQATLCFELILYLFLWRLQEFPDMPEMKQPSQSTVSCLAVYPLLCRLLCLWRLPVGLICWYSLTLLIPSGKHAAMTDSGNIQVRVPLFFLLPVLTSIKVLSVISIHTHLK